MSNSFSWGLVHRVDTKMYFPKLMFKEHTQMRRSSADSILLCYVRPIVFFAIILSNDHTPNSVNKTQHQE